MNPRGRDVIAMSAGLAHADAELGHTAADVARRYSSAGRKTARRTASEFTRVGTPELRDLTTYLLVVSDPYRIEAHVRVTIKQRVFAQFSDAELIERYHELLQYEPQVEADDRALDVSQGVSWLDRAAASERDSAIDAEKAACEREFERRRITEEDVWARRSTDVH